ncbi:MAG: hypothetical protein TECD_00212 [Hyphomicrobiaceae bacterium hypho_1]
MTKIIHTADLHLDSPLVTLALSSDSLRSAIKIATRAALDRIVDIAIEEGVAAVLISGDLYDGKQRSMKTAAYLLSAFQRLNVAGIKVFIVRGNHDSESTITREIAKPENVHIFDGRASHVLLNESVAIHGISFRDKHTQENLLTKFRPVPDVVNIGMLHTSLSGTVGHDNYAPCSVADFIASGFDYWALGHIHRRKIYCENPLVVMPGIPQGRDMGEHGPKSVTLIHIKKKKLTISERLTSTLEFQNKSIDVADCNSIIEVCDAIIALVRSIDSDTAIVLRLTVIGVTALYWHIHRDIDLLQAAAKEAAEESGSVWIDRLVIKTQMPSERVATNTATYEIAELIAEAAQTPSLPAEATEILFEVLSDLPPEIRDHWGGGETATAETIKQLINEASDWAIALMHGARNT